MIADLQRLIKRKLILAIPIATKDWCGIVEHQVAKGVATWFSSDWRSWRITFAELIPHMRLWFHRWSSLPPDNFWWRQVERLTWWFARKYAKWIRRIVERIILALQCRVYKDKRCVLSCFDCCCDSNATFLHTMVMVPHSLLSSFFLSYTTCISLLFFLDNLGSLPASLHPACLTRRGLETVWPARPSVCGRQPLRSDVSFTAGVATLARETLQFRIIRFGIDDRVGPDWFYIATKPDDFYHYQINRRKVPPFGPKDN